MNKLEIVTQLAQNKEVELICKRITNKSKYWKDLAQEVYIILLELDDDLIQSLYENGELNYYIVKIIKNQFLSTTSLFYRTHRKFEDKTSGTDISDYVNISSDVEPDKPIKAIKNIE